MPKPQPRPEPETPPARPALAEDLPRFLVLEREVEIEYRPQMLAALQGKVDAEADAARSTAPVCPHCGQPMRCQDTRVVSWLARCGRLHAAVSRYRCPPCHYECRPLLDLLGVEPGRISGALARLLVLLATVAPYPLAARLAWLLLGVRISPMGIWRAAQRLGEAAAKYSDVLSRYHADSRSIGAPTQAAPSAVVLGVDGCSLGIQVRSKRRRRKGDETLPPLSPIEEGHFREVKTGVLLLPSERVETSPGRRSVVRRFLVSCLGDADDIFARLYAQLRELGWVGAHTVVVILGDGAEWIWNRASMFVRRCEILDFWHAVEHAWGFAQLRYGEGSAQADRWVHQTAEDLRAGKVQEVIARLKRVRPKTPELRESLQALIRYYSENAGRMRYDEYLRLGYGIGSGAVESAHKQVIHARFRQAGMRWSEAGARRLLALRLLLLNDNWALLDRLRMVSLA
ncbi:MAG TPA: ISKra4 family transposase [Candidatus Sulfotelmatobacter sp.]